MDDDEVEVGSITGLGGDDDSDVVVKAVTFGIATQGGGEGSKNGDNNEGSEKKKKDVKRRYLSTFSKKSMEVAFIAALGGVIYGFDIGTTRGTMSYDLGFRCHDEDIIDGGCVPRSDATYDNFEYVFQSAQLVGNVLGAAVLTPWIFDSKGRKPAMFFAAGMCLVGFLLYVVTFWMWLYLVGVFISNIGIGAMNASCIMYLVEIAQITYRGKIITLWDMGTSAGLFLVDFLNLWIQKMPSNGWRVEFFIPVLLSSIFIFTLKLVPESPQYLILNDRPEKAKEILSYIRPDEQEAEWEYRELTKEAKEIKKSSSARKCGEIIDNGNTRMGWRLLLGIAVQSFNQLVGNNDVIQLAPIVMSMTRNNPNAYTATNLYITALDFFVRIVPLLYVDKFGRPLFFISGSLAQFVAMAMILVVYLTIESSSINEGDAIFVTFLTGIFQIGYSISWGPLAWLYSAEIYNMSTRGRCAGIAIATHFIWSNAFGFYFLIPEFDVSTEIVLIFCTVVCALSIPFVYFFMPETTCKTNLEIDKTFVTYKPRCAQFSTWGLETGTGY